MKRTGIFYHPVCGDQAYFTLAMSVREGFESLQKEKLFSESEIILYESIPMPEELALMVHSKDMIERVMRSGYYETSLYSVGGSLMALDKVLHREIDNALVFMGIGGHHSSRDNFWGGCYLHTEAIPIQYARQKWGVRRVAIIDTDTHHADGTTDLYKDDENILYICFCSGYLGDANDRGKNKVCCNHGASDIQEIENVRREVPPRVRDFRPDLMYWVCGLDTHQDSYGTRQLTERCYPSLAEIIKTTADEVCDGKLVVTNGCNAPAHVSQYVMPRIVNCLAELNRPDLA